MANSVQIASLTLEGARVAARAAVEAAENAGINVSIAVVDTAARTKVSFRWTAPCRSLRRSLTRRR